MARKTSKTLSLWLLAAALPCAISAHAQERREVGSVITLQGSVNVRDASGALRSAERRGKLYEGDAVLVEQGGFASLRMVDNAHVSLGSGTEFTIERYRFDGRPATRDSVLLHLASGCFRTTSGVAGAATNDEYRVTTPLANIDVDATLHGATLLGERLYTATWDGATVVSNAGGTLKLGNYGDFDFSRTLPGAAPVGLRALVPEASCETPESFDRAAEPERIPVRDIGRERSGAGRR